ncbi:hypothetical protein RJ640_017616 [Escallonia rubra]|uniref:JmjC domain-containing protein n=1 Tax=Escallonia rubra TaxID=112253 RepID=A0AA88QVT2_9ASTE|nr:hypothetical protein RJ640_017616 [Escallonia rubra]
MFVGSLEGNTHANMFREVLKLKRWLSSKLVQEQFPAHYAEIICGLPLKMYINPSSGLLNLAVKLTQDMPKPDLGPCLYILYGGPEELMQINILAHATDVPISTEQLNRVKNLMKKYRARDHMETSQNTTDWNRTNEVVHPILDQSLFLDTFDKARLREEFNIEPRTFEQHLGEAVFIPAGCPYQIRKVKSCINVVLEFISPEIIVECIKLTDEVRLLPLHNKAKDKILEMLQKSLFVVSLLFGDLCHLLSSGTTYGSREALLGFSFVHDETDRKSCV